MTVTLEQYEERVIVFIDILGFREHIKQTAKDKEYFIGVRDVLNAFAEFKVEADKHRALKREITVFSDSIVISYPTTLDGAVFWTLVDVIHIQLGMMKEKILMRGGITVGELCHTDNIVYGPAMVEAYEIESKAAIYPRVVIAEKVLISRAVRSLDVDNVKFYKKDFDGQWIVDFLSHAHRVDDYIEGLQTIREIIINQIKNSQTNHSVSMKYKWLKNYFNDVVQEFYKELNLYIDDEDKDKKEDE